jgi:hypothetical protein
MPSRLPWAGFDLEARQIWRRRRPTLSDRMAEHGAEQVLPFRTSRLHLEQGSQPGGEGRITATGLSGTVPDSV